MSKFASIRIAAAVVAFGALSTSAFAAMSVLDANVNATIERQMVLDTAPHAPRAAPATAYRGTTQSDAYIRSSEMRESAFSTGVIR
jgi:hypothetical protein